MSQIRTLLEKGASLEASAKEYNRSQLKDFVEAAVKGGGFVFIASSDELSRSIIEDMMEGGRGHVVFR